MSMFKYSDNELGYIQITTNSGNEKELSKLGFVDNVEKLTKPVKVSRAAKPKAKANAK